MAKKKTNKKALTIILSIVAVIVLVLIVNLLILPLTGGISRTDDPIAEGNSYIVNTDGKTTLISAHRAGGDLAPEETLKAFELCMEASDYRVDIVEFDLHLTKDNKLVLMHDDTVNRTSNATEAFGNDEVKVCDKTLEELKTLNFGENFCDTEGNYPYRGLRGENIPDNVKILSLEEILDYLTKVRPDLNYIIEIKDDKEMGEEATDILCEILEEYKISDQVILGTFNASVTKYMTEKHSDIARSAGIAEVVKFYYSFLYGIENLETDYNVLQIPTGFDGFFDFTTPEFIQYAHAHGIAVQYWTINDADEIEKLIKAGADTIITDNPEVAYSVLQKLN